MLFALLKASAPSRKGRGKIFFSRKDVVNFLLRHIGELVEQHRLHIPAQQIHRRDDDDRKPACDHCIFDCRGAALIGPEGAQSRSRSIGMSGRSAGGIGNEFKSRGLTHLIACPSRGITVPSHRLQM